MRVWVLTLAGALTTAAPGQKPVSPSPPSSTPAGKEAPGAAANKASDAATELQRAIAEAGNDRVALVRNLEDYLRRFPDSPHQIQVYRVLAEASMQVRDQPRALAYAERIIALRPDDSPMMLFAVDLLERLGDEHSLTKAVGYVTRVLDRVEKPSAAGKPPRGSPGDPEQNRLRMSMYLIRGRLEMQQRNYDQAAADLEASYRILPNALAAMRLGEIAEIHKDYAKAIDDYLTAFVLPDRYATTVDQREVRRKLGNLWRLVHGSEAGLGDALLAAHDRLAMQPEPNAPTARNKDAAETFAFVLRRLDGSPLKLAELKGRILVLNFWATWCLPCRELEALLEQVAAQFEGQRDVVFLAVNTDEDESRVGPYLERQKMRVPMAFADGLDRFLDIKAIPTVMVLDPKGKITYRGEGFSPEGFVEGLAGAIERARRGAGAVPTS